jgi:hypothetical protein
MEAPLERRAELTAYPKLTPVILATWEAEIRRMEVAGK